jgi:hypothetical protein
MGRQIVISLSATTVLYKEQIRKYLKAFVAHNEHLSEVWSVFAFAAMASMSSMYSRVMTFVAIVPQMEIMFGL